MTSSFDMDNEFVQITINLYNLYEELRSRSDVRANPGLMDITNRLLYITRMLEESLPSIDGTVTPISNFQQLQIQQNQRNRINAPTNANQFRQYLYDRVIGTRRDLPDINSGNPNRRNDDSRDIDGFGNRG